MKGSVRRPGPVNLSPKLQGEWAETRFLSEALRRGLQVAKPYGDSARYDFIVDSSGHLSRVQVKSVSRPERNCFRLTMGWGGGSKSRYLPRDADLLAAYVIPADAWYLIPIRQVAQLKSIWLSPHRPSRRKFEPYREAWELLEE